MRNIAFELFFSLLMLLFHILSQISRLTLTNEQDGVTVERELEMGAEDVFLL